MLKEIENVRQIEGEGFRRWFTDADFDLIVWYDDPAMGKLIGFQLCYDKQGYERALTWQQEHGYSHTRIDDGEAPFSNKMSPVLVADGIFEKDTILQQFQTAAEKLEPRLRELVEIKIKDYS